MSFNIVCFPIEISAYNIFTKMKTFGKAVGNKIIEYIPGFNYNYDDENDYYDDNYYYDNNCYDDNYNYDYNHNYNFYSNYDYGFYPFFNINFVRNKNNNQISNKNKHNNIDSHNGNNNNSINSVIENSNNNQQNHTHLRGLVNIASTCYMNSILQCFSHIPNLYNYFQKKQISDIANQLYSEKLLFPVFREVLVELWNESNNSPYSPNKFKERLGDMNPLFKGAYPNDAKDLLTFILIQLHEELNHPKNSNMNNNNDLNNIEIQKNKKLMFEYFSKYFMNNNRSIISDLFFGIIYTKSDCLHCGISVYIYQLFNFLIFPLQKVLEYKMKMNNFQINFNNTVSIDDCFKYSQSPTCLNDYYCNFCKKSKGCNYTTYLSVLPNIIIIIINRGKGIEYNINLSFDENINLKNYVEFLSDECMYELFGLVTHYGDSSQSGHFVARCISPLDQMWYLYNDSIIQKIGYFNKEEFYAGHPYILFYRKIKF